MKRYILTLLIGAVMISCAENDLLSHIPGTEELTFWIGGKDSQESLLNHITRSTMVEYNSLIHDVFISVDLARNKSPAAEDERSAVWGPIEWGEYIYRIWIEKKSEGFDFKIDIAFSGMPEPRYYVIAEGTTGEEFFTIIDLKNLHNFYGSKYPDGGTLFVKFHPDGITGFTDYFSYFYPSDERKGGYIMGAFYFIKKNKTKCISFAREWEYVEEIPFLYERVYVEEACFSPDGEGEGRGRVFGGELENPLKLIECWDSEGRLLYREKEGVKEGDEGLCFTSVGSS